MTRKIPRRTREYPFSGGNHHPSPELTPLLPLFHPLLSRYGLNYHKISRALSWKASHVEKAIHLLESRHSKFVENALRTFKKRLKKTGKKFEKKAHGFYPIEYYLSKSFF